MSDGIELVQSHVDQALAERRRHRRRSPRREGSSWPQRLAFAASLVTVLAVVVSGSMTPAPKDAPASVADRPPGYETLHSVLQQRERILTPADRQVADQELAAVGEEIQPALIWVLNQPDEPLFAGAAEVATALHLEVAVPPLQAAAWGKVAGSRPAALRALDRLQPLSDDELSELLVSNRAPLQLVALELLAVGHVPDDELLRLMLDLLAHGQRDVRDAALAALPLELPDAVLPQLLLLLTDPTATAAAATLLPRVPVGPASTAAVVGFLADADPGAIDGLLDQLGPMAKAEPVQVLLWGIVQNASAPVGQRAAAMRCLEFGGDDRHLPAESTEWPPLLRYYAARFDLRNGRVEGLDLMLRLMELDPADDPELRRVAGMCRGTLGRIARLPPHAPLDAFVAWRQQLPADAPPAMPPR